MDGRFSRCKQLWLANDWASKLRDTVDTVLYSDVHASVSKRRSRGTDGRAVEMMMLRMTTDEQEIPGVFVCTDDVVQIIWSNARLSVEAYTINKSARRSFPARRSFHAL